MNEAEAFLKAPRSVGEAAANSKDGRREEILSLTSIRGVASTWVVFYHFFGQFYGKSGAQDLGNAVATNLVAAGQFSVDIFFILSGFVIAMVDRREAYFPFLAKRIARIFPLHAVVLSLMAVFFFILSKTGLSPKSPEYFSLENFLSCLSLTRSWLGLSPTWNNPAWSLSVEFALYLGFGVIYSTLFVLRNRWLFVLALLLICHAAVLLTMGFPITGFGAMMRGGCGFSVGVLLQIRGAQPSNAPLAASGLALFVLLAAGQYWMAIVPAAVFINDAATARQGPIAALLASGPLVWLGRVSYSVYLIHVPWLIAFSLLFRRLFPEPSATTLALGLCVYLSTLLLASALSLKFIELPGKTYVRGKLAALSGAATSWRSGV